jgi:hypothetical protein
MISARCPRYPNVDDRAQQQEDANAKNDATLRPHRQSVPLRRVPNNRQRISDLRSREKALRINDDHESADRMIHHRVCLNLDQPLGVDEARHLHDGVGWPNLAKELPVDGRYGLPVIDMS